MYCKGVFIASTGQHVGKTTISLGLFAGLQKRILNLSYMKPIGQEQILIRKGLKVDKDVLIFKEHFHLKNAEHQMSPVLIPKGFTRDFLDQKIKGVELQKKIQKSYLHLSKSHPFLVVEGTGHCGVGSIIDLNNAQVAKLLQLPMILVLSGGLGSSFDELALNKALCDQYKVPILGIVLNKVVPKKQEMIVEYMTKALKRWNLPLLGSIPFDPFLSYPTMQDFTLLFEQPLLTGLSHQLRHFKETRLIATSLETYREFHLDDQLIITPANREDIILATLTKHWDTKAIDPKADPKGGMILTGEDLPRPFLIEELKKADIPMLHTPLHSTTVMEKIHSFTAKIRTEDIDKVQEAIEVVENHIDFDLLDALLRKKA